MKITRISTAVLEANFDWTIIRVETDEYDLLWLVDVASKYRKPGEPFFE